MAFLLNLLFAVLAYFAAAYILALLNVERRIAVVLSVIVAIVVFMAYPAGLVL